MWDKYFRVRAPLILMGVYVLLSVGLLTWHLCFPFEKRWEPIVTGLIAGAFIAVLQFSWDWLDAKGLAKLKALKVSNVLVTRDDEEYYRKKIEASKKRVTLLGSTASRFLVDFADSSSPRQEKSVLLRALERKVVVRVLVAQEEFLADQESKQKVSAANGRMKELADKYSNFQFKYYRHEPAHSIFLVDDTCMVGPIFAGLKSKDTPAIEMHRDSPLVDVYLNHFEKEWADGVLDAAH